MTPSHMIIHTKLTGIKIIVRQSFAPVEIEVIMNTF